MSVKKDDLPWDEPAVRLQFMPGESPYEGVSRAVAALRLGLDGLEKYVSALERDLVVFEAEYKRSKASPGAVERPTRPATPQPAQASKDGKSWRRR